MSNYISLTRYLIMSQCWQEGSHAATAPDQPLTCGDRINSIQHCLYHGCWCPGDARTIGKFLSYLRKDFNYLCHVNVEEWHKLKYTFLFPLKNLACKGLMHLKDMYLTSSDTIFTNSMDNITEQCHVVLYFPRIYHSIHILFLWCW